jgi:hypothetical protein
MANRLIIPVVTINTLISLINLPHAIIILARRNKANRISVVWKGLEEAYTIAKWSKERCMLSRNIYLMVGSDMPRLPSRSSCGGFSSECCLD